STCLPVHLSICLPEMPTGPAAARGERELPRNDDRTGRSLQRCVRWGTRPPFFRPWGGLVLKVAPRPSHPTASLRTSPTSQAPGHRPQASGLLYYSYVLPPVSGE